MLQDLVSANAGLAARRTSKLAPLEEVRGRVTNFVYCITLFLLGVMPGSAFAVDPPQPEYAMLPVTSDDGLPQNRVEAIAQTKDGYLWIGTRLGLARFDGVRFTLFDHQIVQQFNSSEVSTLLVDHSERLWIGMPDGLMWYQNGQFRRVGPPVVLPLVQVQALLPAGTNGVWVGAKEGLAKVSLDARGEPIVSMAIENKDIRFLVPLPDGRLLVELPDGWREFDPEGKTLGPPRQEVSPGNVPAKILLRDESGRRWAATEEGIYATQDGRWTAVWKAPPTLRSSFTQVSQDSEGRIWFLGSKSGALRWNKSRIEENFLGKDSPARWARRVFVDREKSTWLATQDGLVRLQRRSVSVINESSGLSAPEVRSLSAAPDGTVWAATAGGVEQIRNGRAEWRLEAPSQGEKSVHAVLVDRNGTVWFGRDDVGLRRVRAGEREEEAVPLPMENRHIRALYSDSEGQLWIGAEKGLHCLRAGQRVEVPGSEALRDASVRVIHRDKQGALWVGTSGNGICRIASGKPVWFGTKDGLADLKVYSILEDEEGDLWFGTEGGLTLHRDGKLLSANRTNGLAENVINLILERDGQLYLAGLRGVHRIPRRDLKVALSSGAGNTNGPSQAGGPRFESKEIPGFAASRRLIEVECRTIGLTDGMATSETNGERQPAGFVGADGRIWLPTGRGVAVLDPKLIAENRERPKVVIEEVVANEDVLFDHGTTSDRSQLPPGEKGPEQFQVPIEQRDLLQIRYTANTFVQTSKVKFRYRLVGPSSSTVWQDAEDRRAALFTHLRPGSYLFEVVAANSEGRWSESPAQLSFKVGAMVYERWWFWWTFCVLLTIGVAGLIRARMNRQRELVRAEVTSLERERTRIARDLHDDVGANLTGLGIKAQLAALEFRGDAAQKLNELARDIRSLVDRMREVIWAVNPECDTLENLVNYLTHYVESFLTSAGRRCRLDVPTALPALAVGAEARHHLLSVTKEAINNSVRHADATEVFVRIAVEDGKFLLVIRDDGVGFDPDDTEIVRINGSGHGLGNMRKRIEGMSGTFVVRSSPGEGTEITANLNLWDLAKAKTRSNGNPQKQSSAAEPK